MPYAHASAGQTVKDTRYRVIPISYTIDAENGLVLSVGTGVVTSSDLLDYLGAQARDPAVPLPLRDLHDQSSVERFEVDTDAFKMVVAALQNNPQRIQGARLAVVAQKDHVFGLYRMFELLAEHTPPVEGLRQAGLTPQAAVFRNYAEAREWLLAETD